LYHGTMSVPWCSTAIEPWCNHNCSMVQPLVVPWCSEVPWCFGAGCTTLQPKFYHGAIVPWYHGTTTAVLSFSTMVQPLLNHGTTTTVAWCNHWLYHGAVKYHGVLGLVVQQYNLNFTMVQPQLYCRLVPWCNHN